MNRKILTSVITSIVLLLSIFVDNITYTKLKGFFDNNKLVLGKETQSKTDFESGKVVHVADGDTFTLENKDIIRLIGIDAPELEHPNIKKECFSDESTFKLKELILNKKVKLTKDRTDLDRYGRKLRYAYIDDIFINDLLVKEGFAKSYAYPPDIKYQTVLDSSQIYAKSASAGLWKLCKK